jgi:hypothetical protein
MYIARQLTGASLEEIGREFGGRHHTTALHCIRKIEKLRCSDDVLDCAIRGLPELDLWFSPSTKSVVAGLTLGVCAAVAIGVGTHSCD